MELLINSRYIHANYRFIVDPQGDYHEQTMNADVHLEWNNVLQVLASARSQSTSCPICLSTPVAPRIAKCGHIFCLPCLIRYLYSSDDSNPYMEKKAKWKKCPICWDCVYLSEIRPLRWHVEQEAETLQEGDDVVLRLIAKPSGSTLALPRDGAEPLSLMEGIPWYFAAEVMDYARVMKGSKDYMLSQFDLEIKDLRMQERDDEVMFGEDTQWTRKAISAISEAREKHRGIGNPPGIPRKPDERKAKRQSMQSFAPDVDVPDFPIAHLIAKSDRYCGRSIEAADYLDGSSPAVDLSKFGNQTSLVEPKDQYELINSGRGSSFNIASHQQSKSSTKSDRPSGSKNELTGFGKHPLTETPFYFYQALLHYYLSPLDIRILKSAFGDFSAFPSTILPRVERISKGHVIDDDLRKRIKYLAHLPRGCEVSFLECDWTDVVPAKLLERFAPEINRRQIRNYEKNVREEKERARAEKDEDEKRWLIARRRRPGVPTDRKNPEDDCSEADVEPKILTSPVSVDFTAASSSPPWLALQKRSGSAFASLASPSTSPEAPRTVWGTTAIATAASPSLPANHEIEVSDNDGWLQGWERDLLCEDNLVSQTQEISNEHGSSPTIANIGNKKKKKNKRITLMTNNARRAW